MAYRDIRDWLQDDVERYGELKYVNGADCDLEMGAICEILFREFRRPAPAIFLMIFLDIPGYRTLFGILTSPRRLASALYLSL